MHLAPKYQNFNVALPAQITLYRLRLIFFLLSDDDDTNQEAIELGKMALNRKLSTLSEKELRNYTIQADDLSDEEKSPYTFIRQSSLHNSTPSNKGQITDEIPDFNTAIEFPGNLNSSGSDIDI